MSWEVGNETHRAGVLRLLERFRKENVPVDALGIQSHLGNDGSHSKVQRAEWKRFLDSVTAMGYRLLITEFDINDREMPKDVAQRDAQVASVAKSYLDMMLSYPQLDQLLCWGLWDKHSWLNGFAPRADGLPQRPLPYDDALRPSRFAPPSPTHCAPRPFERVSHDPSAASRAGPVARHGGCRIGPDGELRPLHLSGPFDRAGQAQGGRVS
ncbi:endo-1,4-beta-xylanase [Sphingomonas sp. I4]